jgi:uncharacterized membrane protein YgcG
MPKPSWMLLVGGAGLAACSPTLADYCAPGTPECTPLDAGSHDGASDGPTEGGQDAAACDRASAPHDDACVIAEAYGVFVAPAGSDSNPGTRAAPLLTIGHGLDVAKAAGKRVYVCTGTFPEKLVVSTARDGVNLYGALDCATWSYGPLNKVVVAPTDTGYALDLEGLQAGITLEDVEFDAQPASSGSAGESSIAVFANGSQNVAFERVTIVAGNAADGAPGASPGAAAADGGATPGSNWFGTPPSYAELDGIIAGDAGAAPSVRCTCPDQLATSGGQGGGPMNIPAPGAGTPSYSDAGAGAPGANAQQCNSQGGGDYGGDAPVPAPDMPSASFGASSATGWAPGMGVAGSDGKPGQGGGGGGNGRLSSGSGGSGGCGGCGGGGGRPGSGGGSSMALLSFQSSVTLAGCVLTTRAAGNGGAGGSGEPGEGGGGGGSGFPQGNQSGSGCAGGAGGAGAGGNGAQGGPGGLSLGVGYVGAAPTIDGAVVTRAASRAGIVLGSAGMGGAGGTKGAAASSSTGPAGADGAPGQAGVAAAVESLP